LLRALVICCTIVVAVDAVAATGSKLSGIPFGWFAIPQTLICVAIGFTLSRSFGLDKRFLTILVTAGIAEASIGRYVSAVIGPGKLVASAPISYAVGGLVSVASGTLFSLIGGWAAKARP
jgi:hypothetical protein